MFTEKDIDIHKLHKELIAQGIPAISVCSDGRVDYARPLTTTEKKNAERVISLHDPTPDTAATRREAYLEADINLQDMVFALWSLALSGDRAPADKIQAVMDGIDMTIN